MNRKSFPALLFAVLLAAVFCASPAGAASIDMSLGSTKITLPWAKFESIIQQVKMIESVEPETGRKYIVNSVAYEVTTQREQLKIDAVYTLTVFTDSWLEVPLEQGGRTLAEFSSSAGGDTIFFSSGGKYSLLCSSKGDRTIKLTMYAPGKFNKYDNSYRLYLSPEAVSRKIKLVVPEEGVDAEVASAAHSETFSGNGRTVVIAAPGNDDGVYLRWERTPEAEEGVAAAPAAETELLKPEPRILADITSDIYVADNSVVASSRIFYKIMNTSVKEFTVEIPASATVQNVSGPPIREWKEIKGEATKTILVSLLQETEKNTTLYISTLTTIESGRTEMTPPVPKAIGVDREKGSINIGADDNIEINVLEYKKAAPIDISETSAYVLHFLSFKYLERPFTLLLELKRNQKLAAVTSVVDLAAYTSVKLEDGKFLTMCSFYMRNNNLPFLKIDLPEDAEVWSALVNDRPAKPSRNSEGLLLVPLPLNSGNKMNVEVLYLRNQDKMKFRGKLGMDVPMPEATVTMLMWEVYTPADYDYYGIKSELEQYAGKPFINNGVVSMETDSMMGFYDTGKLGVTDFTSKTSSSSSEANVYRDSSNKGVSRQNITRLGDYVDQQVMVQNMAPQEVVQSYETSEGVLPIKINLPTEGNYYYFQKVMPGEGDTKIEMNYLGGKYLRFMKGAGMVLAFIAAVVLSLLACLGKAEGRPLAKVLLVLFAAGIYLNPGHQGFLVAIAALALVVALVFLVRGKRTAAAIIAAAIVAVAASGAHAQGTVSMDWNDYNKLMKKLEATVDTTPLLLFVLSDADYSIRAADGSLLAEAVLSINSFTDKQLEIPIFNYGGQAVTGFSSTVAGDRLLRNGDRYALLISSKGHRTIRLSFAMGVSMERLEGNWSFSTPKATSNSISFFVPERKIEIDLDGAANVSTDYNGGGTRYTAAFPPTSNVSFSWKRKADDIRPEEMPEPRTDAAVNTLISVSEGIVSYNSTIRYEVNHAGIDSYSVVLPAGVDIIDVTGNQVRDMAIGVRDGEQVVRVLLSEKMRGSDTLKIKYEKVFSPGEPFETVVPQPQDVTSLSGAIGITGKQEIEILPVKENESLQVDPSEVADALSTSAPILFAYKYFEQPEAMQFKATVNESVAVVTSVVNAAKYTTVIMPDGRRLNSYSFELETRDRQFFNVFMPDGCKVWSVTVNGRPVIASEGEDNRVLIPVRNATGGGGTSTLTAEAVALCGTEKELKGGKNEIEFPHIEIPISKLETVVYVPREWQVKNPAGNLGEGTVGAVELLTYYIPSMVPAGASDPYIGVKDFYYDQQPTDNDPMGGGKSDKKRKSKSEQLVEEKYRGTGVVPEIGVPGTTSNIPGYKGLAEGNAEYDRSEQTRNYEMSRIVEYEDDEYVGVPEPAPSPQQQSAYPYEHKEVKHMQDSNYIDIDTGVRRGALPVRIYLPKTGRVVYFSRSMVIGETPKVEFTLRKEMATRTIKYAGIALVVLLIALVAVFTPLKKLFGHSITGPAIVFVLPLLVLGAHRGPAFDTLLTTVFFISLAVFVVRWIYRKATNK